jgi:hypothetical protein
MPLKLWNPLLLVLAVVLATVRPVLASNGWLGVLVNARASNTESSEDESERETEDSNSGHESRKTRRDSASYRAEISSRSIKVHLRESRPEQFGSSGLIPATEHAYRYGLGTPLRI